MTQPQAAVLVVGDAFAVLVACDAGTPAGRDAVAQRVLRCRTGAADLVISRRPSGRPRLAPPYPELGVSMAHRGGLLLVGFSPTAAIGVDFEPQPELQDESAVQIDAVRLAVDHFAPDEARAVASLAAGPKDTARFATLRLWVAKEAALKATGRGIADGLAEPDLSAHLQALLAPGHCSIAAISVRGSHLAIGVDSLRLPSGGLGHVALARAH